MQSTQHNNPTKQHSVLITGLKELQGKPLEVITRQACIYRGKGERATPHSREEAWLFAKGCVSSQRVHLFKANWPSFSSMCAALVFHEKGQVNRRVSGQTNCQE